MARKKAVIVTVTKSKHKSQPYSVSIDKPGKSEPYAMKERYTRPRSARLGALRNLNAVSSVLGEMVHVNEVLGMPGWRKNFTWYYGSGNPIEFRYIDRTKSTKRDPLSKAFDASGSWRPTAGSTKKK